MNIAFIYMNDAKNIGRGAGYIVASIPKEHKVKFYDTRDVKPAVLISGIARKKFNMLMVSSMTLLWPKALYLIDQIKKRTKIPILVGGVHPTLMGKRLLRKHPKIDYACVGEGESFIRDFLQNYPTKSLSKVAGLVYRRGKKVFFNPANPPEDLSKLPKFPWTIFPNVVLSDGFVYVTASRGCPFNCPYCCNGVYLRLYKGGYVRNYPMERVIGDLQFLKRTYGQRIKLFYFGDDMMFANLDYARALFLAVKEQVNVPYGCMGRAEYIDEDLVDLMKRTGCEYVALGIECGDEEFRKKHLRRSMTNEQIINAFELLKKAGIRRTSFNMIGWPYDYDDRLCKATVELNRKISPDTRQVTWFYPFPGTDMHNYCVENDLIKGGNTETYFTSSILKMHSGKPPNPNDWLDRF